MINLLTSWLSLVYIQISFLSSSKKRKKKVSIIAWFCVGELTLGSVFLNTCCRKQRGMCCQILVNQSVWEGNAKKSKLLSCTCDSQVCGGWWLAGVGVDDVNCQDHQELHSGCWSSWLVVYLPWHKSQHSGDWAVAGSGSCSSGVWPCTPVPRLFHWDSGSDPAEAGSASLPVRMPTGLAWRNEGHEVRLKWGDSDFFVPALVLLLLLHLCRWLVSWQQTNLILLFPLKEVRVFWISLTWRAAPYLGYFFCWCAISTAAACFHIQVVLLSYLFVLLW